MNPICPSPSAFASHSCATVDIGTQDIGYILMPRQTRSQASEANSDLSGKTSKASEVIKRRRRPTDTERSEEAVSNIQQSIGEKHSKRPQDGGDGASRELDEGKDYQAEILTTVSTAGCKAPEVFDRLS